jgi:hypothetical protein
MSREGKIISIAILTVFLYALGIFFQKGAFIFPFPLNEIIFLFATFSIGYTNFKTEKVLFSVFLCLGICHLFSNEFYYAIVLDTEAMQNLSKSLFTDIFLVVYYIGLLATIVLTINKINSSIWIKGIGVLAFISMFFGMILGNALFDIVGLFLMIPFVFKYVERLPILNLWTLLFVLEVTKFWSLMS